MGVDPYAVIAGARRRGWSEAMIARKLGLRDGHTGYGITRHDEQQPIIVVPGPRQPIPALYSATAFSAATAAAKALCEATPAPDAAIQAKCQGEPMPVTERSRIPALGDLFRIVADVSGVSPAKLKSARRARELARPRQVLMWLARKYTPMSLPKIGLAIGNRDHTTVMHGARRVDVMLGEGDPFVGQWVRDAEAAIAAKFPDFSPAE